MFVEVSVSTGEKDLLPDHEALIERMRHRGVLSVKALEAVEGGDVVQLRHSGAVGGGSYWYRRQNFEDLPSGHHCICLGEE